MSDDQQRTLVRQSSGRTSTEPSTAIDVLVEGEPATELMTGVDNQGVQRKREPRRADLNWSIAVERGVLLARRVVAVSWGNERVGLRDSQ